MYVGEKSNCPEESLPLMVHSPTTVEPVEVSSVCRPATWARNAATAFPFAHPTACMAACQS
jgi:hypothetical protein